MLMAQACSAEEIDDLAWQFLCSPFTRRDYWDWPLESRPTPTCATIIAATFSTTGPPTAIGRTGDGQYPRARRDGILQPRIAESDGFPGRGGNGQRDHPQGPADLKVTPNFDDYDATRASFAWSQVPDVRRDGIGAAATSPTRRWTAMPRDPRRIALCCVSSPTSPGAQTLTTHDVSYAELGRLTRTFTNVLRSLGSARATRFRHHGPGS